MFVNETSQGEQSLLETVVMAGILLFLLNRTCLHIKRTRFPKKVWKMSLSGIYGLYPGGFLREYAKINIHSFLCCMQNETELTQNYKSNLHSINYLSHGTTFLREFTFFGSAIFFCFVRELIFGIVKDWFLGLGVIFFSLQFSESSVCCSTRR